MENTGTQGAMDAIDEALGITEAAEDEELDTEGEEGAADDADDTEGDASEDGEGDAGDDAEGEEGAEAAAAAKGERNPDGTFKKPGEVKKPDPVNDPLPKDLKKETSERMQSLIKTVKDKDVELTQVRTDFDTIINGIKASGSTPEQYGEAISWLSLFNSPEPASRMKAYELVNDVADRMATMLGIDRTVPDLLAQHPDLKASVAANQITAKYANEIARTRNAQKFTGQINDTQRQQQQTQAQAAAEDAQARTDLNTFDVEMRAKDPLYDQKRALIVPILRTTFKLIPKAQWAATYKQAYAEAKVKPKGAVTKAPTQPLRGNKNPAGGQARQATSMMDAINGALASVPK
jgi:hypothetical protein